MPDVLGCVAAAGAGRQAVSVYHAGPAVKHGQSVHRRLVSGSIALLALPPFAAGCPADDPTAQRVHHACTALEQVPSYLSAGDTRARLLPSTCSIDQAQQHTSCHKHAQPSSTPWPQQLRQVLTLRWPGSCCSTCSCPVPRTLPPVGASTLTKQRLREQFLLGRHVVSSRSCCCGHCVGRGCCLSGYSSSSGSCRQGRSSMRHQLQEQMQVGRGVMGQIASLKLGWHASAPGPEECGQGLCRCICQAHACHIYAPVKRPHNLS